MSRRLSRALWLPGLALLYLGSINSAVAAQLLVPAYFGPGPLWNELTTAAAAGSKITVILNPDSGPGTSASTSYKKTITAFENAGGTVVGYVATGEAQDSLSSVEAQISAYQSFYPINGIFLDEMSDTSKSSNLSYYSTLYSYIKGLSASYQVVGNPGTNVPQAYAAVADTLVTYEDTNAGYAANTAGTWAATNPASQFANVVYEVPSAADMLKDLSQAEAQNVGYVYFTDDGADGNPYDSLPSYFQAEAAAVPEPATLVGAASIGAMLLVRRSRPPAKRSD